MQESKTDTIYVSVDSVLKREINEDLASWKAVQETKINDKLSDQDKQIAFCLMEIVKVRERQGELQKTYILTDTIRDSLVLHAYSNDGKYMQKVILYKN
jgi:hypothetical protein